MNEQNTRPFSATVRLLDQGVEVEFSGEREQVRQELDDWLKQHPLHYVDATFDLDALDDVDYAAIERQNQAAMRRVRRQVIGLFVGLLAIGVPLFAYVISNPNSDLWIVVVAGVVAALIGSLGAVFSVLRDGVLN